jgi:hypothetical protein
MKIRVLGGGWYGAHIARSLIKDGHDVELHESTGRLFSGASGSNPARLHLGFHYPRSAVTRAACLEHRAMFMQEYGHLTRPIAANIYAVADHDSLVDFGTYRDTMRQSGVEFLTIYQPHEFYLRNVEGALLTGERHVLVDEARAFFEEQLGACVVKATAERVDDPAWDLTVDCTFCAYDEEAIDRFEPCVMGLLESEYTSMAVTIMDGPFPSIYPWDERRKLLSLTSARLTPLSKTCKDYASAKRVLEEASGAVIAQRCQEMLADMEHFWPGVFDLFKIVDYRLSIRAMPRSGADSRLVDVVRVGERALRVRAGKIDAIFHAERVIKERLATWRRQLKAIA